MIKLECPGCGDTVEVLGDSTTVHHRCPLRRNRPVWYEEVKDDSVPNVTGR